jgi:hypothetical protein
MDRVPEMLEHIKEDMAEGIMTWQQQMLNRETDTIKSVIVKMLEKVTDSEEYIIVSYLRSSFITWSHHFKVALYNDEPYVETFPAYELIDMTPYYKGIDERFEVLMGKIKTDFIRVLGNEIEEIRRFYMEQLYFGSLPFFQRIAEELAKSQGTTPFLFGGEMGETYQIGVI